MSDEWAALVERAGGCDACRAAIAKMDHGRHTTGEVFAELHAADVDKAVEELGHYALLTVADFDAIVDRYHVDPTDDLLVDRLVRLGWEFNEFDGQYISP